MSNLEKALNDHIRGCAPYVHVADFEAGYRAAMRQEPTHYAVIDEHGEIVQAWKIAQYRSAEILCENLIKAMSAHDHDTDDWTVKGVTVHES